MFPQIFGKYVLERELASGGMARVYLATLRGAVGFEKRLVVKQIRPELASDQAFVRRFVEEAKTTVDLSHPNIVPVYELGVEQGVYYIAMELCAGVTLAEILRHGGPVSPEEGAYLGVEICRALDYAHRRAGIVHRDVTPRNVLIDEEGAVRLIDFGIAAPVADSGLKRAEIFGSPGHMPPEQLAGKKLSPATDVFAVAVLLFEAWTGKPVFRRATSNASQAALLEPVCALSERVPALAPLSELIARGLSLDPSARPAQAELFARPLRDFLRNVDAGDVARRLGARVRRAQRPDKSEESEREPSAPANSAAFSLAEPVVSFESSGAAEPTCTFAVREEVSSWTRRFASERPPLSGALPPSSGASRGVPQGLSTRKLPSLPPSGPASEPAQRGPTLGGTGEAARVSAETTSPHSAAPLAPVADALPAHAGGLSAVSTGSLWVFAFGVAVAVGGIVGLDRARRASASGVTVTTPAPLRGASTNARGRPMNVSDRWGAPSAAPNPGLSAGLPQKRLEPALDAAAPRPPQRATSSAAPRSSGLEAPRAPRSSSTSVHGGILRITADPAAGVSVQGPAGSRSLTTPVRDLKLPVGVYVLTFRSQTYPEPVVARVALGTGDSRSVHVDFRNVEPRVIVR